MTDATPQSRQRSRTTRARLAVVGVVILGAIGFLLYKTLTSAIVYFKTAQEAVADRGPLGNSTFQIEGVVVPHSIRHESGDMLRFVISSGSTRVPVENQGAPPELFQQNIPVVLVGHFVGSSDLFSSDQILVKHSNAYIAAHPKRVRAPNGSVR
jgi:cytochrome c-type biogenesis protein CcmE